MRQVQRHVRYKTEICRTYHRTGTCLYGVRCTFIHDERRRRQRCMLDDQSSVLSSSISSHDDYDEDSYDVDDDDDSYEEDEDTPKSPAQDEYLLSQSHQEQPQPPPPPPEILFPSLTASPWSITPAPATAHKPRLAAFASLCSSLEDNSHHRASTAPAAAASAKSWGEPLRPTALSPVIGPYSPRHQYISSHSTGSSRSYNHNPITAFYTSSYLTSW